MTVRIALSPEHRRIVLDLLAEHLPHGGKVWVFGSRATGRARRYSDLDLAIDAGRPLRLAETAILREAFEESDLPWRVDIVDWRGVDERFRRAIAPQLIPLLDAAAPEAPEAP
ncbi:MAG: nucleotidyltransferase family protein [Thiohalocapsa sp.]